ncbi:MAG TPA: aspartate 1-decarboxylase [Candidatus Eisenbacteria bacterium]|nr:aspartate 1-decarboxylase [Candidatus Eisenbacteria bacterium]
MKRRMFLAKIHRAVVTDADLNYEGSVTIDDRLLDAAGILNHEEIHVWNLTRGSRFTSYAISGDRDSGVICVNGAAAHLTRPGDLIIIAAFGEMDEEAARRHAPRIVRVDSQNRIVDVTPEIPGPRTPLPAVRA